MKKTAKLLALSGIMLSSLGGCAVYGPGYPAGSYYEADPYGQPVYSTAPVYAAPMYVGPPAVFSFGFRSGGGGHDGHRGGNRGFGGRGHR